ncbi:MAG: hypothetical protein IJR98_00405, partial [Synergistaceae bacterium]|nr:hypothetical protein [Synergistaceae bacterium]
MNTHTIRKFIIEPDSSGNGITALCFLAFSVFSTLTMSLIGVIRIAGGHYASAGGHFVLSVLSLALLFYSLQCLRKGRPEKLSALSYPLTAGGFIFGLTALFFLDGGIFGGVPLFFILAVVATPCFMTTGKALVMMVLEILAYVTNAVFAHCYPGSIDLTLAAQGNTFVTLIVVTAVLGLFSLLYTFSYRHQQSRLDSAIRDAKSANEAKSSFLNNMSHEIRTPMNSILGMNEMILREEERPEIREYALVIQRSGRALLGMINDVLDFSKLQDNKMEIVPVRYDLSSLINDLISMAAEQAKKKSLTFTVNVDKEIPRILDGDEY